MSSSQDSRQQGKEQLKALLWRQWLLKSRQRGSTAFEIISPVLLMSLLVLSYGLVKEDQIASRIYVNETGDLLNNITEAMAASPSISAVVTCMQLLQDNHTSELSDGRRYPAAVPGEVPCPPSKPGVRCRANPCARPPAACRADPFAACVPFFCQDPVDFRGKLLSRPCSAVYVDTRSGQVLGCDSSGTAVEPPAMAPSDAAPNASGGSGRRRLAGDGASSTLAAAAAARHAQAESAAAQLANRSPAVPVPAGTNTAAIVAAVTRLMQNPLDAAAWAQLYAAGALSPLLGGLSARPTISASQQAAFQQCLAEAPKLTSLQALTMEGLQDFVDVNGPIPIPTFDEFVLLHKSLQSVVESNEQVLDTVRGARRSLGWNILGNLIDSGQLAFAPATPEVLALAEYMRKTHEFFTDVFYGVFKTEEEGTAHALQAPERLWALIVFNEGPDASGVDYTIRMNFTTVPRSYIPVNKWRHHLSPHYKEYLSSGALSIQNAVDTYVLGIAAAREGYLGPLGSVATSTNASADAEDAYWTEWGAVFPTASYVHNRFYDAVGPMLGLLMALCLIYPLSMLIRGVVEEKELRARETMLIMGLRPWVLTTAWAATYAAIFGFVSLSVAVVCCASFLPTASFSLLLISLLIFSAAEIAFGLMMAAIFSRAKVAAIVGPMMHFAALMPRYMFLRTEDSQALVGKGFAGLLAPTAFTFGADLFAKYEGSGKGLGWGDIWADPFPMGEVLLLLVADTLLYASLAWYLERTLPSQYGPRLPFWFPLSPSFWRTGTMQYSSAEADLVQLGHLALHRFQALVQRVLPFLRANAYVHMEDKITGEAQPEDLEASHVFADGEDVAVRIMGLQKVYGSHQAVKELSFDMRASEITALLGHNGAGKTTLVGCLTGLLRPTAGDCIVLGNSIVQAPSEVRRHLGICPQQNVLFGQLTVWEHLLLYCAVKGIKGGSFGSAASAASEEMLVAIGLSEKRHTAAAALSGGMKRKLQVGLALLGGSQVVVLDEPTSGMDPVSRRGLWALLRQHKQGRALLLTTHYLDEADLLAEKIVILSEGSLRCMGSSLELKEQYGRGYTLCLTTVVDGNIDRPGIQALVHRHVPGASVLRSCGAELVYQLPLSAISSFPDLLDGLETKGQALGINHYGVSMPTLEEVFLRVTTSAALQPEPSVSIVDSADEPRPQGIEMGWPATWASSERLATATSSHVMAPARIKGAAGTKRGPSHAAAKQPQWQHLGEHAPDGIPKSSSAPGVRQWARKQWASVQVMVAKRSLCALADKKGMFFTLILPVLAIAFVLLILTINIDPTSPSILLTLETLGNEGAIPVSAPPAGFAACMAGSASASIAPASTGCGASGLTFVAAAVNDSEALSRAFLQDMAVHKPPLYGGLVFDDPTLLRLPAVVANAAINAFDLPEGAAARATQAAASAATGDQVSLPPAVQLLLQASPEGRVLTRTLQRLAHKPVTVMYNASSYHALPSLLSDLHEVVGAIQAHNTTGPTFTMRSHPLPLTESESTQLDFVLVVLSSLFVLIPFCYLTSAYAIQAVAEQASGARHMQLASGCSTVAYWLGSLLWDLFTHSIVVLLAMVLFAAYQHSATTSSFIQALGTVCLLMAFGVGVIPLVYCLSFSFNSPSAAQVAIAGLNLVAGFVITMGSFVMQAIEETRAAQKILVHFFRLLPPFNLGEGLVELAKWDLQHHLMTAGDGDAPDWYNIDSTVFAWPVLGRSITYLLLEGVCLFGGVLLLQWLQTSGGAEPLWAVMRQAAHVLCWPFGKLFRCFRQRKPHAKGLRDLSELAGAGTSRSATAIDRELELMHMDNARPDADFWADEDAQGDAVVTLQMQPGDMKHRRTGRALSQGATVQLEEEQRAAGFSAVGEEDADVAAERNRVTTGAALQDTICLQNLRKTYATEPPKVAVHHLCLGIPAGERFGFLGPNGAGKTTTLSILAGTQRPTSGQAYVKGVSIFGSAHSPLMLGYCPQVDPLIDLMTAVEQLEMYAHLKGVDPAAVRREVLGVLQRVALPLDMAQRPCGTYSGGNKRKLSLAIALVGRPAAVLLDEPSSGMDPGARRAMWNAIITATSPQPPDEGSVRGAASEEWDSADPLNPEWSPAALSRQHDSASELYQVDLRPSRAHDDPGLASTSDPSSHDIGASEGYSQNPGISVVLTSHSMEEVAALASRVGIMHLGRLVCLGSLNHLRALYGGGYLLEVQACDDPVIHYAISQFVHMELGGSPIEEGGNLSRRKFRLQQNGASLAAVFRKVEAAKQSLQISAYSVSQPTLEDVFLNLIGEKL